MLTFTPENYAFSGLPCLPKEVNNRNVLAFNGTSSTTAYWEFAFPLGGKANFSLVIQGFMASATTGAIALLAQVEAISPGDFVDMDASNSFTTFGAVSTNVPANPGDLFTVTLAVTDFDSAAGGDYARFLIWRIPGDAGDTAAGDFYLTSVELRDST